MRRNHEDTKITKIHEDLFVLDEREKRFFVHLRGLRALRGSGTGV